MKNNFFKYWAPLYLYAGIIFYISGISRPLPEVTIPFFDKALHVGEYALFGLLAARAFKNSSRKILFENFKIMAVLTAFLYGVSDEIHQSFIAERQFSIFDMFADAVGGTVGTVIYGGYTSFSRHVL